MDIAVMTLGALTGILVGMTGMGGAIITTPILLLYFDVVPVTAIGTDLLFAAITKIFAASIYEYRGLVDWQVAKRLWLGSLPISVVLLWLLQHDKVVTDVSLLWLLVGVVFITAIGLLFQPSIHAIGTHFRVTKTEGFKQWQSLLTVLAGAVIGLLVTLTSMGAGVLAAVLLLYLYPLRLTPHRLVATDIIHAIPLAIVAGLGYWLMGYVDASLLFSLLIGSIPTVLLASYFSIRLPQRMVRWALSLVLITLSFSLGWKSLSQGASA